MVGKRYDEDYTRTRGLVSVGCGRMVELEREQGTGIGLVTMCHEVTVADQ